MSDEQDEPTATAPAAAAMKLEPKWGDLFTSIPIERQEQLKKLAEAQRAWLASSGLDRQPGQSPLAKATDDEHPLNGAEVIFMTAEALSTEQGVALDEAVWPVRDVGLLATLHLEGANFFNAQLMRIRLTGAHLDGARLTGAHLEGADLRKAHLEGADLYQAHLEEADLRSAYLENASLDEAHLEGANLAVAHLEGASLFASRLKGANLRGAFFSTATDLTSARFIGEMHTLSRVADVLSHIANALMGAVDVLPGMTHILPRLADVRWQNVNLAVVMWPHRPILGDERDARELAKLPLTVSETTEQLPKNATRKERKKAREWRRFEVMVAWRVAARAYRQLASVMREQGMNDEADNFAYRANYCQRQVYRYWGEHFRRLGSWLLDLTSGHGYRPARSLVTYLAVVFTFAVGYYLLGHGAPLHLTLPEALFTSIISFHGRGFFPTSFNLANSITPLVAAEAICGLLIEITFIATFTQRFFSR